MATVDETRSIRVGGANALFTWPNLAAGDDGRAVEKVQHPHAGDRGWEVAFEPGLEQVCQNVTQSNARRLAACWNACEGISTEDLEQYYGHQGGVDAALHEASLRDQVNAAAQRDELLKVLQKELPLIEDYIGKNSPEAVAARAASPRRKAV